MTLFSNRYKESSSQKKKNVLTYFENQKDWQELGNAQVRKLKLKIQEGIWPIFWSRV